MTLLLLASLLLNAFFPNSFLYHVLKILKMPIVFEVAYVISPILIYSLSVTFNIWILFLLFL